MRKSDWRIKELHNGQWTVETRSNEEWVKSQYPDSIPNYTREWYNYETHASYKAALRQATDLEAKETFDGQVIYPPFPEAKPFWKFW